jgi:ankyrin repeat domain-containing protein 50
MGAVLVILEAITYITNRCTIYEILYGSELLSGQEFQNLNEARIALYSNVLRAIVLAYRICSKSTADRALGSLFNPEEVSDILSKCQDLEQRVEIEANNCERMHTRVVGASAERSIQELQQMLGTLKKPILRIDEKVLLVLEKMDEHERIEILEWTSKIPYGNNHATVRQKRTALTCEWLLRHKSYQDWQRSSSSAILWLHGSRKYHRLYI